MESCQIRNEQMQVVQYSKRPSLIVSPAHCFFHSFVSYSFKQFYFLYHTSQELLMFTNGETKAREQTDAQKNILQNSSKDGSVQECLLTVLEPQSVKPQWIFQAN